MAERARARLVHSIPGRVRLVFPEAKGNAAFLADMAGRIAALPPVTDVAQRPLTGSLVVSYQGPAEALLAAAGAADLVDLVLEEAPGSAADAARERAVLADLLVALKTGGVLDIRSLAFLGFLGVGLWQLARGGPLWPPAATAFWYAASALLAQAKRVP